MGTEQLAYPPGMGQGLDRVIGYDRRGRSIFNIGGGAGVPIAVTDDDDDAEADAFGSDTPDDDDDDDGDGDAPDTRRPPDRRTPVQDEVARLRQRLRVANQEAQRRRGWLEQAGIDPHTGQPAAVASPGQAVPNSQPADQPEPDPPRSDQPDTPTYDRGQLEQAIQLAADRAAAREQLRLKPALVRAAAAAALAEAGWSGQNTDLVMRLVEHDSIDVDDDGVVVGLQEQIDEIRTEFPDWFRRREPRPRRGAESVDGSDRSSRAATRRPPSWVERINADYERGH